jgi:catalase
MLKTASMPAVPENKLLIDNQKNPTNVFAECEQEKLSPSEVSK